MRIGAPVSPPAGHLPWLVAFPGWSPSLASVVSAGRGRRFRPLVTDMTLCRVAARGDVRDGWDHSPMRAPAGLSPIARGAFRAAADAVQASGRDPHVVAASLRRYALAADRLEKLREAWDAEGCPPTVLGARGQTIPHPTLREMRNLEAHLDDLLKGMGVLLAPPAKAGHLMGMGQAPDRRPRGALLDLTDRLRGDERR